MDEQPETDDGYVTLVNAEISPDGTVAENYKEDAPLGMEASSRRRIP